MLVLTRQIGEIIVIETPAGERIEIAVLGVKGNQVRVGTDAPEYKPYKHAFRPTADLLTAQ